MEDKKVKQIYHDIYPINITGMNQNQIEKAIQYYIKEYAKDNNLKLKIKGDK
jgi:hypothetical protein